VGSRISTKAGRRPAPDEARLAVNLPSAVHRQLKRRAAERGCSIRQYILELLAREGIR
jgi:hypothetical protein